MINFRNCISQNNRQNNWGKFHMVFYLAQRKASATVEIKEMKNYNYF